MNAHQLDANGIIINTIVVNSLDVFPDLIDASIGGVIGDVWTGTAIVKNARDLEMEKAALIARVKSEAGEITQQVLQGLVSEYELAEREASEYKVAGYPNTPIPSSVQSEINSKAAKNVIITATVACDTILAAATAWRTAQAELRDNRLTVTSAAEIAEDAIALDAIKEKHDTFMTALKVKLGILQNDSSAIDSTAATMPATVI
jgi:hypothetical protein